MDPVLGEVGRLRWLGASLVWCELVEGTVRPGCVVMRQILGQDLAQVVLTDDKQPVEEFPAQVPIILSQIAFALGACRGLARILTPAAMNTASEESVNWPARSLIRNLTEAARCPRSIRKLRAACVEAPPGWR